MFVNSIGIINQVPPDQAPLFILGPKAIGLGHLWALFVEDVEDLTGTQWTHSGPNFEALPYPLLLE